MDPSLPSISEQERYRIIADLAPMMIWMTDADKRFNFFNVRWLHYTGRSATEEYGKGWTTGIHPDDMQHWEESYSTAFDRRQELKVEFRLQRENGHYGFLLTKAVPIYSKDGTFRGYVGSSMDLEDLAHGIAIAKEQALNEELAASNEELVAINEELGRAQDELQQLNSSLEEKVSARTAELTKSEAEAQSLNEELSASNEELSAMNEEMTALNEELFATNEELHESQDHLQHANEALNQSKLQLEEALEATQHSEQLFKSIALNIPGSMIIVIDRNYHYLALEGDLMVRMGYDSKNYVGKHPLETGQPERYEAARPLYDRVLSGEQFSVERKASTGEDFLVHLVPLRNKDAEVYAGLVIALDITDIKQAQEKSAKLAAIVESSDDAIISKNLESVIASWNESAERMFGYTAEEIVGDTIYRLIPDDRKHEEEHIISRMRNGERVEHFETQRLTKDGRLIDVSVTVSPIRDSEGRVIGASKIARDITEKKLDEQRKNDFIGMVSHELKTPLTSLTALLQVLQGKLRTSPDAFIPGALDKANVQIKRMTGMINGFLNLSRLESGKIMIDIYPFDLNELIREVVAETAMTVSSHVIRFDDGRAVMVDADRDKIASVLSNLIGNAVKYSPKGKSVEVKSIISNDTVTVSVRDEGIGISTQDQERLFDRYYRVESSQTRHISGFGIGLYLSAEIIERHEGRIWIESEPDRGSTFYFSLPVAPFQSTNSA